MTVTDFYTYRGEVRPFGNGTPVAYRYDAAAFVSDALGELAQGELVCMDTTNNRLLRFNRTAANGKLVGVTRESAISMKKLGNQPAITPPEISVFTTGIHLMLGTVGETYTHNNAVFMNGTDTTKITKTQGSNGVQVGQVWNPLNLTYSGVVRVPILIDDNTLG